MNRLRNTILAFLVAMLTVTPAAHAVEEGFFQEVDEWIVDECGEMWSSSGDFRAYLEDDGAGNNGVAADGIYRAELSIKFSQSDIDAFKCVGDRLEVHFLIGGFDLTDEIQRNSRITSTLPGGRKMLAVFDKELPEVTLRYGTVQADQLVAGVRYDTQLSFWGLAPDQYNNPWVSIRLGLVTENEDEGTFSLFLTRGYIGDVLYFHYGGRAVPFGF